MPVMKQLRIGSATYDTVGEASVTQVQTSGTKIATVTIDGTATDLYAPEGGGGGSTVTVTQTLTSGTEIASVSVDGTATKLYAPTYTLPTASTSTLGGVKVDGSTITIANGVISSSGGGGGGSTLTLYTDDRNYVLYIDAALTDDIASHYDYDYQTMYQVLTDANSIKIINDSTKTTYYPQTVRYVSADDEIRVTAGSVVWNV